MTLNDSLRIPLEYGFININTDLQVVGWVEWNGFYEEMNDCINKALIIIKDNK